MANPLIHAMFRKIAETEILPHVTPVPGMTPAQYLDLIDRRFANPAIVDTVRRVAFDGSSRQTGMDATVRDGLQAGVSVEGLALVQAAWARMCQGTRDDGSVIEPNDPFWPALSERANEADQPAPLAGDAAVLRRSCRRSGLCRCVRTVADDDVSRRHGCDRATPILEPPECRFLG